jgi:hypothetical protein
MLIVITVLQTVREYLDGNQSCNVQPLIMWLVIEVQDIFRSPSCFATSHEGCIMFIEWGHGTGDKCGI